MRWPFRTFALCLAVALSACGPQRLANGDAKTAGPHFANLCIARSQWPRLLVYIRRFGASHGLGYHGGIDEATPDGRPEFNAYLAQGYSYLFGDDFDLWFTSDPFRPNVVGLGGIVKNEPITPAQKRLAKDMLGYIADITVPANGPLDDPNCGSVRLPSGVS